MAQERVTITGDIIDDVKSEGDPSETVRENMLVGRIESTSELVEESCIVDGRFKEVIREKGTLMSQTWTDLFSLMNQYEAELLNKSGEIDIREAKLKSEESRLNLSALKSSQPSPVIAVLQQDNVEKDEKIMTYMGEINSLEKELAELRKELQLKDFHIQTIEKELANKDADVSGHEQRIKVLDQRILDLSAEIKNKDFVISQVSKQVRSMSMPGGKSRSRELRKRPLPIQVKSGPPKVLRTGDDATSAISLRASPRQTSVASSSKNKDNAQSSPEDSNEDDPKDTDYIFEGGAESVYDDFDNPEPEPSTSDNQVKVKTEPTEESGFQVSMAKYHRGAEPDYPTMPLTYPVTVSQSLTGSPVVCPKDSKKTMTIFYQYHKSDLNSSPTMTPFAQQTLNTCSTPKYNIIPNQQCVTSTGVHTLERLPPTKRRKYSQKRCRVCYRQGRRRETTMYCPTCPSNPGLCAGSCFEIYHTLSPAEYEVKPSFLTPEDEAKSSALLVEHSHSLLEEMYGIKTESLDSTFNESVSGDMDSSAKGSPTVKLETG